MRQWRLIYDQPLNGALNMAADEAILRAVVSGAQPPTLRLYAWEPGCLSLGYGQSVRDVDTDRLQARGWGMVRRITGGRAILHIDELTYSVTLPEDDPLADGGIVESYRRISEALLWALRALGARPAADPLKQTITHADPVCFETPSHYEITVDGRKLVGSAQARRYGGLLQHGTLPLTGDITRICDVLIYDDQEARLAAMGSVRLRALTLEQALGFPVGWSAAAEAVAQGFAAVFERECCPDELSEAENRDVQRLAQTVYADEKWTLKR
jgi:lipoate-protein ligase A